MHDLGAIDHDGDRFFGVAPAGRDHDAGKEQGKGERTAHARCRTAHAAHDVLRSLAKERLEPCRRMVNEGLSAAGAGHAARSRQQVVTL
jgi:hypothetical protein